MVRTTNVRSGMTHLRVALIRLALTGFALMKINSRNLVRDYDRHHRPLGGL